jgi:hypothetical protein
MKQNRKRTWLTTAVAIPALVFTFTACDVKKTSQGEAPDVDVKTESGNVPKYDVDVQKTEEGKMPNVDVDVKGGKLPTYDVTTPDIEVNKKEVDIKVPNVDVDVDVRKERKDITVPDVDIKTPDEKRAEEKTP